MVSSQYPKVPTCPARPEAIKVFQDAKILYAPGKAANAGGVSVSGLEMSQNSERLSWTAEEVDNRLKGIMKNIHENCVKYGKSADGYVNYVKGANVAGFIKVAKAMMAQGLRGAPPCRRENGKCNDCFNLNHHICPNANVKFPQFS
jgi:hypothetical protein